MGQKAYEQKGDYIPSTDAGFKSWLANYRDKVQADAAKYGLSQSDAALIDNIYTSFAEAYDFTQTPEGRNPTAIANKDSIRASAIASMRVFSILVKGNKAVDNAAKISLGIHVDDPTRTAIPAPDTAPMLFIEGLFSGEHQIRFADETTPHLKRRPYGAIQIELYVHIAPGATLNPENAKFIGAYGRGPITHSFSSDDVGKCATYFARWRTQRGLVGPWSAPVCMTIAFGGPVENQMFHPQGGQPGTQTQGGDELKIAA